MPRTNSPHSTTGLSMKRCHCSRVIMRGHVVSEGRSRKPLAGKVHSGLALVRRARRMSAHC